EALAGIRGAKSTAKVKMRTPVERAAVTGPQDVLERVRLAEADLRAAGGVTGELTYAAGAEELSVAAVLAAAAASSYGRAEAPVPAGEPTRLAGAALARVLPVAVLVRPLAVARQVLPVTELVRPLARAGLVQVLPGGELVQLLAAGGLPVRPTLARVCLAGV